MIPDKNAAGLPVTRIADATFYNNSMIQKVILPNTIEIIDDWAFGECSNLQQITIPDSVTVIDYCAFYSCTQLTSIQLPSALTTLGAHALRNLQKIVSITVPSGVTRIEEGTFWDCISLEEIIIPNSVEYIAENAFVRCLSLQEITLPSGIEVIKHHTFNLCEALKNITIPDGVECIEEKAFHGCSSLTSITIPNSVTSIGDSAFESCTSLTSVTLPNNVTTLGDHSFRYCTGLKSIIIPQGVTNIGYGAFWDCKSLESIIIPNSVKSIGNGVFIGCQSLSCIQVASDNNWYTADEYALFSKDKTVLFSYSGGAPSNYTIPSTVINIAPEAFRYFKNITRIIIPDSVKTIGEYSFAHDENLTSIYIPGTVQTIDASGFWIHRNDLVIYGEAGSKAEEYANENNILFVNCQPTTIAIAGSLTKTAYEVTQTGQVSLEGYIDVLNGSIGIISVGVWGGDERALTISYNENEKTHVNLFDIFTIKPSENINFANPGDYSIAVYAKAYGSEDAVKIGEATVKVMDQSTISDFTFNTLSDTTCEVTGYTGSNTEIVIPNTDAEGRIVMKIGDEAFEEYLNLMCVTIPNSVTSIGDRAFANSSVKKVIFPESMELISDSAFDGCSDIIAKTYRNSYAEEYVNAKDNIQNTTILTDEELMNANQYTYTYRSQDGGWFVSGYTGDSTSLILPEYTSEGIKLDGVDEYCFENNNKITDVYIPGSYKMIHGYSFYNCTALKNVYMEDGTNSTQLSCYAFAGCTNLEYIRLSNSISHMQERIFQNCKKLKILTYPLNMVHIPTNQANNWCWTQGWAWTNTCALNGSSVETVIIPEGANAILKDAFFDATSLKDIYIPASVTTFDPDSNNYHVYHSAFESIKNTITIHAPAGSKAEEYANDNGIRFGAINDNIPILPDLSTLTLVNMTSEEMYSPSTVYEYNLAQGDLEIGTTMKAVRLSENAGKMKLVVYLLNEIPNFKDETQIERKVGDYLINKEISSTFLLQQYVNSLKLFTLKAEDLQNAQYAVISIGAYENSSSAEPSAWAQIAFKVLSNYEIITYPESITILPEKISLYPDEIYPLWVSIDPIDATEQSITWTSSDSAVATVENGVVKAIAQGTIAIVGTTANGLSAETQVTVLSDQIAIDGSTEKAWNVINGQATEKSFTISVTRNVEASVDSDWISCIMTGNKLVVQVDEFVSSSAEERVGTVTLSNGITTATLAVRQSSILSAPTVTSPVLSMNPYYPTEMPLEAFNLIVQRNSAGSYLVYAVYQMNSSGSYDFLASRFHEAGISSLSVSPTAYSYKLSEGQNYRIDVMEMTESYAKTNSFIKAQTVKTSFYVTFVAPPKPDYPRGVKAETINSGIKVTWNTVSDAAGYYVTYNGTQITVTGQNTKSYTIDKNTLTNGTVYTIYVDAYNENGDSTSNGRQSASVYWYKDVLPTAIVIQNAIDEMVVYDSHQLEWAIEPEGVDGRVVWTTSDSKVI